MPLSLRAFLAIPACPIGLLHLGPVLTGRNDPGPCQIDRAQTRGGDEASSRARLSIKAVASGRKQDDNFTPCTPPLPQGSLIPPQARNTSLSHIVPVIQCSPGRRPARPGPVLPSPLRCQSREVCRTDRCRLSSQRAAEEHEGSHFPGFVPRPVKTRDARRTWSTQPWRRHCLHRT